MAFESANSKLCERTLYHLICEDGKHYVGMTQTSNFDLRIDEQFGRPNPYNIPPARFCQMHKPIELASRIDLPQMTGQEAEALEDAFTLICKKRYGEENVCGGHECASPTAIYGFVKGLVSSKILPTSALQKIIDEDSILDDIVIESN